MGVHVISKHNRHLYPEVIRSYHRCRYDVFVKERGWKEFETEGYYEYDGFDDEHAVYLILLDNNQVLGGQRFYPTIRPHMLSEIFPHLSQWPLPRGQDVWECTRYFVVKGRRGGRADAHLMLATHQFCLEEGITQVTGVSEMSALSRRLQAGLRLRPLGLPHDVGGEPTVAVVADITQENFEELRRRMGKQTISIVRNGLPLKSRMRLGDVAA